MQHVIQAFEQAQGAPSVIVRAPGRINFIGGHTDYHEGWVLPAAVGNAIHFAFRANGTESDYVVQSLDNGQMIQQRLGDLPVSGPGWAPYVMGLIETIRPLLPELKGFHCYLGGDLPQGAGLSSSAALTCGLAAGLNALAGGQLDRMRLAVLAQKAEQQYAQVQCGIMDQLAVLISQPGEAFLLDCRSLALRHIPARFPGYRIMLIDSGVKHADAASGYNTRRAEGEEGLQRIQSRFPEVKTLRDVTSGMLSVMGAEMPSEIFCRCAYVVAENARVQKAANYLAAGRLAAFGDLMFETHVGLRDLYRATCPELDFLAEMAAMYDGCLGARMIGGGFGGCLLAIVEEEKADAFSQGILQRYAARFGQNGRAIPVELGPGLAVSTHL